jgi:small subunit ribosomal protein S4
VNNKIEVFSLAVNKDPVIKRCRKLGISPAVMGVYYKSSRFAKDKSGMHKKVSEYGLQLTEKQKLKFIYGMMETPFRHYFEIAAKMEGKAGDNLITLLESRLDNIAYRMGLASTRREARQLVGHGHFAVNGVKVDIPSYRVKPGDAVTLREKSRKSPKFKEIIETGRKGATPGFLEVSDDLYTAKIVRAPAVSDLDFEVSTQLIVELYSKN